MPILFWDRPRKNMPVEDWKSMSFDSGPPGSYVPNMSEEDARRFRARLVGTRSDDAKVEIRTTRFHCQLVVVVSLRGIRKHNGHDESRFHTNVRVSANGPIHMDWDGWEDLTRAIKEAQAYLTSWED